MDDLLTPLQLPRPGDPSVKSPVWFTVLLDRVCYISRRFDRVERAHAQFNNSLRAYTQDLIHAHLGIKAVYVESKKDKKPDGTPRKTLDPVYRTTRDDVLAVVLRIASNCNDLGCSAHLLPEGQRKAAVKAALPNPPVRGKNLEERTAEWETRCANVMAQGHGLWAILVGLGGMINTAVAHERDLKDVTKERGKAWDALLAHMPRLTTLLNGTPGFGGDAPSRMVENTGDLINYADIDKVYKRLGLACHSDGSAQGRPSKDFYDLPKPAQAVGWTERGYSKRRRASAHWVVNSMSRWGEKDDNIDTIFYKGVYWRYKQEYIAKDAKHADGKAKRKLIKLVLRHFYKAWWRDVASMPAELPEREPATPAVTPALLRPKAYPKKAVIKRMAG